MEKLETMIAEYGAGLYRFCLKLTSDKADADDLYQETFLKALEHLSSIRMEENPKGYLFSICINLWKSGRRKQHQVQFDELDDAILIDVGIDVEDFVIVREMARMVSECVAELDIKLRIPMYLHYTSELTIPEIAKAVKIPEGTVKSRLFKARTIIQKKLGAKSYE